MVCDSEEKVACEEMHGMLVRSPSSASHKSSSLEMDSMRSAVDIGSGLPVKSEVKRFDKILNNYIKPNVSRNVGQNITIEEKMSYKMVIDEITLLFINHYRESKVKKEVFIPFDEKILQKKNVIFS